MRFIFGKALIFCLLPLCSLASIQVQYFSNGSKGVLYHSGSSAKEMHESLFRQMESDSYIFTCRACPFFPQDGHRGSGFFYGGSSGWGWGAVSKDGVYILDQVNINYYPTGLSNVHDGVVSTFCTACTGNLGFFLERGCFVVDDSPADKPWLWNGAAQRNASVKDLTYHHNEAGNIDGYSLTINEDTMPFGAYAGEGENFEGANGSWVVDPLYGPKWQWNPGVTPPIDPTLISDLTASVSNISDLLLLNQETLTGLASSGLLSADRLSSVVDALNVLQTQTLDYTPNFLSLHGDLLSVVDAVNNIPSSSGGGVVVPSNSVPPSSSGTNSVTDLLVELKEIESILRGETVEDDTEGVSAGLVSSHNGLVNALDFENMSGKVTSIVNSGTLLKDTVNTLFGSWKTLPREVPKWQWSLNFSVGSQPVNWSWKSEENVPADWWLYVQILRNAEVVGLAIWLVLSLSKLLHRTFGGAS